MTVSLTPRGLAAARFAKALAIGGGDRLSAHAYAQANANWKNTQNVVMAIKAQMDALTADDLAASTAPILADLAEHIRPLTIIGRLTALHRVPLRVRLLSGISGARASWAGPGKPIPVSSLDFAGEEMLPLALSTILVVTKELIRAADPAAELLIRNELAKAIIAALDGSFIDPDFAGVADESPASISYGATAIESSGSTVSAVLQDLQGAMQILVDAGMTFETAAWVMSPATAVGLATKRNNNDCPTFPGLTARGGTLLGLPVITSPSLASAGSPGESALILIEQSQIAVGADEIAEIDSTAQATLQMDDEPADGAQPQVSLFQMNLQAFKATLRANWRRRHSGAVAIVRSVQY